MPNTPKPITDAEVKETLAKWTTPIFYSGPYSKLESQTQASILGVDSALLAQAVYFASIGSMNEVQRRMECVKKTVELNPSAILSTLLIVTQIYIDTMDDAPSEPLHEVRKEDIDKAIIRKEATT